MMKLFLMLTFTLVFNQYSFAEGKNVAIVKMVRGKAHAVIDGQQEQVIKKGEWIQEGFTVKTQKGSFVRLSFIDKSTMNVGPSSQMKIEKFSKKEAGVINVLSGKIRSQVTKDYLQMNDEKSKLFVKSKSAVMGIRGTDFIFSANPKTGTTTAVLFEGSVVFNKINPGEKVRDLESVVNRGHRIRPGQFSVTRPDMVRPTVPAKMSSSQFRALEKNKNFAANTSDKSKSEKKRSIVPPGLTGRTVASEDEGVKEAFSKTVGAAAPKSDTQTDISETKGYARGNDVKPVDGSLVHIDSGTIIPLGVDSKFDPNTKEWVSPSFDVDAKGEIVAPKGFELNDDGKLLKLDANGRAKEVILEIKPLDQAPVLEELPVLKDSTGPSPAGVPAVGELKRPPIMDGQTIQRDNLPVTRPRLPATPTRFRVTKP
ncbi:MAG: FecR domain-containing protein [Bacteriovoracaceae bacterium]|nr:FecR domain-containing protein [Bacteriovoracaceae bacterium]